MQLLTHGFGWALAVGMAVVMLAVTGCEDNNSGTQQQDDSGVAFRIDPSAYTITTNDTQITLTVVGGVSPFTWTMSVPGLATISGTGGRSRIANYTPAANQTGVNTVEVQDSQGWIASSIIVH